MHSGGVIASAIDFPFDDDDFKVPASFSFFYSLIESNQNYLIGPYTEEAILIFDC